MANLALQAVYDEIGAGILLAKCQQCGCMRDAIATLTTALPQVQAEDAQQLTRDATQWARKMKRVRYDCLGCEHCYPAAAQNAVALAFPEIAAALTPSCGMQVIANTWPPVPGEYMVVDAKAPVAVTTLASLALVGQLATAKPEGLAIVAKTETENIGIDKLIKNTIANPAIRVLLVCGLESAGHHSGQTLLALAANGTDAKGQVIGSTGTRPVLRNVSVEEVAAFRAQVQVVDMIGCEDVGAIGARVGELTSQLSVQSAVCSCATCEPSPKLTMAIADARMPVLVQPTLPAEPVVMDKAGYFVVLPLPDKQSINVEHYGYDNALQHTLEGKDAKSLYKAIIFQGWVTELTHAAYLGMELAKAELALQHGLPYIQDGA